MWGLCLGGGDRKRNGSEERNWGSQFFLANGLELQGASHESMMAKLCIEVSSSIENTTKL